jgi:Flp pilus assembly protein TadD, contains TPR repeats
MLRKKAVFYSFLLFVLMFSCANPIVAGEEKLSETQWLERGNQFFHNGNFDEAEAAYNKTIKLNPKNANAYNQLGLIYKVKKQYELAISDFTKAIEFVPNNAYVYYNRGDTYFANKQYESAVADFSKSIELNPKFIKSYIRRGSAYYEIVTKAYFQSLEKNVPLTNIMTDEQRFSYFDQIIADLSKAIELKPDFAYGYIIRGNAYSDKGQSDLAIADYDKALKLNEHYVEAYYFKGLTFKELKKKQEALENYNKFLLYAKPNDIRISEVKKSIEALEQDSE